MAVTLRLIIRCVADYFGTMELELKSERRQHHKSRQRQAYYFLARDLTGMSLPRIGAALGGRDHTTVIYHLKEIDALMANDASVRALMKELKTVVLMSAAALERLGVNAGADLDPVEIAGRLMNTPLGRLQISTEELQALGHAVLNMHDTIAAYAMNETKETLNGR